MDLVRQYIVQAIINAANNLRLSTEKIEVVALVRENISTCSDLEKEIHDMKKVTELSTFAIKLNEIYNYIALSKVDFLKVSDKFKEHSYLLVKDLNNLLDRVTPQSFRQLMIKMHAPDVSIDLTKESGEKAVEPEADSVLPIIPDSNVDLPEELIVSKVSENEKLKEEIILQEVEEEKDDTFLFENYEEKILKPIKELDALLKNIAPDKINPDELKKYLGVMRKNAELSSKNGFDIIADMHKIFAHSLHLIESKSILPIKEVVEGMRACLIVIVAVIRGKEVDITSYLNRAENFGRQIQTIK